MFDMRNDPELQLLGWNAIKVAQKDRWENKISVINNEKKKKEQKKKKEVLISTAQAN
jgi:hypothetical protein